MSLQNTAIIQVDTRLKTDIRAYVYKRICNGARPKLLFRRCFCSATSYWILAGGDAVLRGHANAFLRSLKIREMSWSTVRAYGFDLVIFLRWLEKTKNLLSDLTQAGLLDFIESRQKAAASPTTINRRLGTCGQYYRFIYDQPLPRGSGVTLPRPYYKGQDYDRLPGTNFLKKMW